MKTKNPFFTTVYNTRFSDNRWGSTVFRIAFGYDNKLPSNSVTCHSTIIGDDGSTIITLMLKPANRKNDRSHRVFVFCGKCNKTVPAGRIHQHTC